MELFSDKKIKLSMPEKMAVEESMETLARHIYFKEYNETDKALYNEFQNIINKTFEVSINNKVEQTYEK